MRVLITGCNGQVGSCLTKQLSNQDNTVVLALNVAGLDITNEQAVHKKVNDFKPTVIINAAAYTAVDQAEKEVERSYAINCDGARYLAEAANEIDAAILHISTDYVFSGEKKGLYDEADITDPQSVYGASKLAGESAVEKACNKHIILRTAWVFGEVGNNFIKSMLRLGKDRDALSIVGDQFGGPTYAGDIARVLIDIAERIDNNKSVEYGLYHFSGLPHVSWFEFAQKIFNNAKEQGILAKIPELTSITTAEYPTLATRPKNSKLATSRIKKAFAIEISDWKAAISDLEPYIK